MGNFTSFMLPPHEQPPPVFVEEQPLLYDPQPAVTVFAPHAAYQEAVPATEASSYSGNTFNGVKHGLGICCNLPTDVLIMITAVTCGFLGLLFELDFLILGALLLVSFNLCGCVKTSIVTSIPSIFICGILAIALIWRDLPHVFSVYVLHHGAHSHNGTVHSH